MYDRGTERDFSSKECVRVAAPADISPWSPRSRHFASSPSLPPIHLLTYQPCRTVSSMPRSALLLERSPGPARLCPPPPLPPKHDADDEPLLPPRDPARRTYNTLAVLPHLILTACDPFERITTPPSPTLFSSPPPPPRLPPRRILLDVAGASTARNLKVQRPTSVQRNLARLVPESASAGAD